jgi:hypothetical protein
MAHPQPHEITTHPMLTPQEKATVLPVPVSAAGDGCSVNGTQSIFAFVLLLDVFGRANCIWVKPNASQKCPLNLDADHISAIRAEIGERLRVLLSKEQTRPPPRVPHLLDCLSALDDR